MATFVFVHGACHGAWCWERVEPRLRDLGHRTVAIDLPGAASDPTPARDVTLDLYASTLVDVLDAQPEPVILVGHSLGGATITRAAESAPARLRKLVYVAALLPDDGETAGELMARLTEGATTSAITPSADGAAFTIDEASVTSMFYGRCAPADAAWASARLTPQPFEPLTAPVRRTAARFGRVPRVYIECTADNAVPIAAQRAMIAANPGTETVTMDADHSPFLCDPAGLAAILDGLAA